jgi:dipeptidyl-peptidase-4
MTQPKASPSASTDTRPLGPEASPITFERMARYPEPGWLMPRDLAFSPDGKLATFLKSETAGGPMALHGFDVATGQTSVVVRAADLLTRDKPMSREEELRRERQRERAQGITSYRWAKRANVLVIPLGGEVFVRGEDGRTSRLAGTEGAAIDPKPCASGARIAFARGRELVVVDVATQRELFATKGAPEGVTRGQSDFNGQEEFGEESGFFWSPTCDRLAYLEVDERGVDSIPIVGYRGHVDLMLQRYPAAGRENPKVRVVIVELATRKTTRVGLPGEGERYVGRFAFASDGKTLYFQALSRDQKRLALVRTDTTTGKATELFSETSPTWIELADMALLEKSRRLVWTSGSSGHLHLELRDATSGAKLAQLTTGEWDALAIEGVDEARGAVLATTTTDGPLERQLYRVSLDGGGLQRLTTEPGVHAVALDASAQRFADVHSAADRPPVAVVREADGAVMGQLPHKRDDDFDALAIRTPKLVTLKSATGEDLFGALLEPRHLEPGRRYPAVVMVYGGPGVQTVLNQWAPRLMWQHLADRGFVVFQLDNRGSSGRGPRFAGHIHERLGEAELADQLAGADYLESLPFVAKGRLGIYGHSYGGFMAALAMLKTPGRFQLGIAGSPVTDWSLYDTGYTERFMGTPEHNASGYASSDLAKLAPALEGKLFLLHALMDENVHFRNTAELIDALVVADKDFDLLVFPGERHGYRSPAARKYALRRVIDYLVQHL